MKALVFGGTGYIGTAVVDRLLKREHVPVLAARASSGAVDKLRATRPGLEIRVGDLADASTLPALVTPEIDGIIQVAVPTGDWETDEASTKALLAALAVSQLGPGLTAR